MAHALVTGCCIAAPIVFVASTVGAHAWGQSWTRSVLFALFVTYWGGLGFGCMFGSVVWATRLEAATASAPAHTSQASTSKPAEPTSVGAIREAAQHSEAEHSEAERLRPTG